MDNKRKKEIIRVGDLIKDTWYNDNNSLGIVLKVDEYSYDVFWVKIIGFKKAFLEKHLHYEYAERIDQ